MCITRADDDEQDSSCHRKTKRHKDKRTKRQKTRIKNTRISIPTCITRADDDEQDSSSHSKTKRQKEKEKRREKKERQEFPSQNISHGMMMSRIFLLILGWAVIIVDDCAIEPIHNLHLNIESFSGPRSDKCPDLWMTLQCLAWSEIWLASYFIDLGGLSSLWWLNKSLNAKGFPDFGEFSKIIHAAVMVHHF